MSDDVHFDTVKNLFHAGCTIYTEWTLMTNDDKKCTSMEYWRQIDAIGTAMLMIVHEWDYLWDNVQIESFLSLNEKNATEIFMYGH